MSYLTAENVECVVTNRRVVKRDCVSRHGCNGDVEHAFQVSALGWIEADKPLEVKFLARLMRSFELVVGPFVMHDCTILLHTHTTPGIQVYRNGLVKRNQERKGHVR
jgi:hypothetical protein